MTAAHHAVTTPDRRVSGRTPAIVIVLVILAIIVGPFVLDLLAPTRTEGTVGVYQRQTLRAEVDGAPRIGGFIAPAGWQIGDDDDAAVASFLRESFGESSVVVVSLLLDVADPAAVLRDGAPAAAVLAPVQAVDLGNGLPTSMIAFDLQAGDRVSERILTCSLFDAQHCLLFEAVLSGDADADALREMVSSAEVI